MDSPYDRIHEGMDVLDLGGEKVGTVISLIGAGARGDPGGEFGTEGRDPEAKRAAVAAAAYMEVRRSNHNLYIPFSAINEVRNDAVYLIADREAVAQQGWNRPPRLDT